MFFRKQKISLLAGLLLFLFAASPSAGYQIMVEVASEGFCLSPKLALLQTRLQDVFAKAATRSFFPSAEVRSREAMEEAVADPLFLQDPAGVFFRLGAEYFSQGDYDKAEICFVESIAESDAIEFGAYLQLGRLYEERGEKELGNVEANATLGQLRSLTQAARYFYQAVQFLQEARMEAIMNGDNQYAEEHIDRPYRRCKEKLMDVLMLFKKVYNKLYEKGLDLEFENIAPEKVLAENSFKRKAEAIRDLRTSFNILVDETEKAFSVHELNVICANLKLNQQCLPQHIRVIKTLKRINGDGLGLIGIVVPQGILLVSDGYFKESGIVRSEALTHEILDGYCRSESFGGIIEFTERLKPVNHDLAVEETERLLLMQWLKSGEWQYTDEAIGKILVKLQYNVGRALSLSKKVEKNLALMVGINYANLSHDLNLFEMISAYSLDPIEDLAEFGKYYVHEGARLRKKVFFELQNGRKSFAWRYSVLMANVFDNKQFGIDDDNAVSVTRISDQEFEFSDGKNPTVVRLPQGLNFAPAGKDSAKTIIVPGLETPRVDSEVIASIEQIQSAI